ncbi:MAG: hypothetical protein [Caudoviricetes sp.]|nr:MAG: hypothetical protein [Caudoviricetes sp.]
MLMNGKEVNHLIIGGEQFDKNYFGKHVKIKKEGLYDNGHFRQNGEYFISDSEASNGLGVGEECVCLTKFNDFIYIVPAKFNGYHRDCWVPIADVEFLN